MNHKPLASKLRLPPLSPPSARANVVALRLDVGAIGANLAPASMLIEFEDSSAIDQLTATPGPFRSRFRIVALGHASEIDTHPLCQHAHGLSLPDFAALPGLVNAHTHLDLTDVGPRPREPGSPFADWLAEVIAARPTQPDTIAHAVRTGADLSYAGGVVAVGDIAGCPSTGLSEAAPLAFAESGLAGVSFVEFFAIGEHERASIQRFETFMHDLCDRWPDTTPARLGISPHAPYTVGAGGYAASHELGLKLGLPVCTHLAESFDEREFITHARGAQRDLLANIGFWSDSLLAHIGLGNHPIEHTLAHWPQAGDSPHLVTVHVNDLGDDPAQREAQINRLLEVGAVVAYCPRASEFFGAAEAFGPHRYAEMIEAGVPVALGTDSIINLPPEQAAVAISTWHDAQLLVRRDGLAPSAALDAITTSGALALGLDPDRFVIKEGSTPAGLALVRIPTNPGPEGVFGGDEAPTLLLSNC